MHARAALSRRAKTTAPPARRWPTAVGLAAAALLALAAGIRLGRPAPRPVEPLASRQLDAPLRRLVDRGIDEVRSEPRSAEAHAHLGLVYEANEMWEEAQACYREAVRLAPGDVMWRYRLAVALQGGALPAEASEVLSEAVREHPTFAPAWHRLGLMRLDEGNLDSAESAFEKAIAAAPNESGGYAGAAQVKLARKDFVTAASLLERALSHDPGDRTARYGLGLAYRGLGREEDAARELQRGRGAARHSLRDPLGDRLTSNVKSVTGQVAVAIDMMRSGQFASAASYLEAARAERPEDTSIQTNLGIAYMESGQLSKACDTFQRVAARAPEQLATHVNLGECLMRQGDRSAALAALDRAVALAPHSGLAHLNRGRVLFELRRVEEAIAALGTAAERDPGNAVTRFMLAQALSSTGRLPEARDQLAEAHRLDRASPDIAIALAQVSLTLGDRPQAERALAAARRLAPAHPALAELEAQIKRLATP